MLKKATRAAFALSSMLDNTACTETITKLNQLIEPFMLYGAEQWLPYIYLFIYLLSFI